MKPPFPRIALLGAALVSLLGAAHAQEPGAAPANTPAAASFQSIPPEEAALYRFNFGNFFSDEAAFGAALQRMDATVARLRKLRGKVIATPSNLYTALIISDDVSHQFSKLYWYLDLQYSVNTQNTTLRNRAADLDAKYSPMLTFVNDEIQKISMATFNQFAAREPRLKAYRYVVEESLRSKPHTLSLKEEELLGKLYPLITRWQEDQFDLLMERAPWGKVKDPQTGQELDVRQDEGILANSVVRDVRREANDRQNEAYRAQRDLFAFDVINVARTRNKLAQIRGFKNGQDAAFFGLHLSYSDVENAYEQILSHGELRKRMQNLQRNRIRDFTGYDTVNIYDMSVVPPGVEKPRFTINEARTLILDATQFLGAEYQREMAHLLDPKNGRLDIVPGANRVPNAFAIPSPRFNSVFYSYGYQGYLGDVSTLIHEGGHVVHHSLENNAKIPPAVMDGPRYFTEGYAIFNEYVLVDKLYREATDPGLKVYYLEQLLQRAMGFYGTARIAAVEKAIFEGVEKDTIKTADDLDKVTFDIGRKTSIWHELDPATNMLWQQIPHFYGSPTYYVNYVFADLLAQTYFAQYKKDPAGFARRFTALLRNGFNDTPANLLKKYMGVSLQDPALYAAVFQQHTAYVDDLERLYQQVPVPKQQTARR